MLNSIPQTTPAEFTSSVRSLVMMLYFTELYVSPVGTQGLCLEKGAENFQGTMPAEGGEISQKSFNIIRYPDQFQGFTWRTYAWTHIVRIWSCKFVLRGVVIVVPGDALSARESTLKAEDKTCSMHPVHQKSEEGFRKKSWKNLQLLLPLSSCHAFCLWCVSFVNISGQFPTMWPT